VRKFLFLLCIPLFGLSPKLKAQEFRVLPTIIIGNDTVPLVYMPGVSIVSTRKFKSVRDERVYRKLVRDVEKVYPYAKLAGVKYFDLNEELKGVENKRERKKLAKQTEREIKDEFSGQLKNLTVTQGRILIKLIDRETSDTGYEVVKELRGGFSAVFWQGLARIFGHNLKAKYDPKGEDREIEQIIRNIEYRKNNVVNSIIIRK
jgi:hypothetical protein